MDLRMSCSIRRLLLAAWAVVLLFCLCSSQAASNFDCCLRYTHHILPPKAIVGFRQQLANEGCDINAVVLYTKRKLAVCADPKQTWVKRAVRSLSQKVKKM